MGDSQEILWSEWETAPLPELVAHLLSAYHAPTRQQLAKLTQLLSQAQQAHGAAFPVLERMRPHVGALTDDLLAHFQWEEQVLFPALLEDPSHPLLEQRDMAEQEHASAEELLTNLRALTQDYAVPEGAPAEVRQLMEALVALDTSLHRHIYLETFGLMGRGIA